MWTVQLTCQQFQLPPLPTDTARPVEQQRDGQEDKAGQ